MSCGRGDNFNYIMFMFTFMFMFMFMFIFFFMVMLSHVIPYAKHPLEIPPPLLLLFALRFFFSRTHNN